MWSYSSDQKSMWKLRKTSKKIWDANEDEVQENESGLYQSKISIQSLYQTVEYYFEQMNHFEYLGAMMPIRQLIKNSKAKLGCFLINKNHKRKNISIYSKIRTYETVRTWNLSNDKTRKTKDLGNVSRKAFGEVKIEDVKRWRQTEI